MNPLRFTAENLRCYPSLEFAPPAGISAIVGSNGSGKSSLLGGLELALFADGARDLAPALGPFQERLALLLEFEHGGERYRVRRGYSAAGRGKATLDLERAFDTSGGAAGGFTWEPLTMESAAATQAHLEALLGLSRATFGASAYLAQGSAGAFPEASPAERKALIGSILDPRGEWPRRAERASAERKAAEANLAAAQTKAADREEAAASVPERWRDVDRASMAQQACEARAGEAERAWDAAKAALAGNQAAAERWQAASAEVRAASQRAENARERVAEAERAREDAAGAQAALATLAAEAERIPELERLAEEHREATIRAESAVKHKAEAEASLERQSRRVYDLALELDQARAKAAEARQTLEDLDGSPADTAHCDRCQQILGAEAREAALASLAREAAALGEVVDAKLAAAEEAERLRVNLAEAARAIEVPTLDPSGAAEALVEARRAAQERAALAARLEGYEAAAAKLPEHTAALTAAERALFDAQASEELARGAMADPDVLRAAEQRCAGEAEDRRAALREAAANHTRAEEALARAQESAAAFSTLRAEAEALHARLALLRLAERAFGRDGIPALIAENAVPQIEAEANRVLEAMPTASGSVFRVELRTLRALKGDASQVRETLDILIRDRHGAREYLTYSGGEKWRVSFALRWALARLLAGRRGAESRVLIFDEPDSLDAVGMDSLAAFLRGEGAAVFEKVLIVSHNPLLAEAFEQVVRIESDGNTSRIVAEAPEHAEAIA